MTGKHERKPEWRIEVPSNAEAIRYIRAQEQQGKISKGTADEAIRQVQKTVKGITFTDKGKAQRTAAKIKGAKVVSSSGYSEQKGCPLFMLTVLTPILAIVALICFL